MSIWILVLVITHSNTGGIDVMQFADKGTCEAAGAAVVRTASELDPPPYGGTVEWECIEVPSAGTPIIGRNPDAQAPESP